MSMKKKLIIHIGSHKTGTTTIQLALYENQHIIEKQGFSFATVAPYANLHNALDWVSAAFVPDGLRIKDAAALVDTLTSPPSDVIIASSENFSFFFKKQSIEALHELLNEHFQQVEIVVYLRRQDFQAISHHQEGSKPYREAEELIYGYGTTALPTQSKNLDIYLDYEQRIGMWIDVFGLENITVRIFERDQLESGDVLSDFLKTVGIEANSLTEIENKNVSLGLTSAKVGHMMNARRLSFKLKRHILDSLPLDSRMMPARADAEAFYAHYRDSNIRLNARLGNIKNEDLFSDDFSTYPQEACDRWTEGSSETVIGMLLDHLAHCDGLVQADDMRDAAMLAHRTGNGPLALRLMRAAVLLRPDGPFILEKYKEFETLYGST